jgi:predicted CoA-binding protein
VNVDEIRKIVRECRRIAVLGIKPESRAGAPAFYVPEYMARHGYDVVPVPVYYPGRGRDPGAPRLPLSP